MVRHEFENPATGQPSFGLDEATEAEALAALDRARAAAGGWAALPAQTRGRALREAAARLREAPGLAQLIVADVGKPIAEARGEVERAARILEYFAGVALLPSGGVFEDELGGEVRTLRAPRGTVLLITPWNFPLAIPVWKAAPALLCGNAVVLKPAGPAARVAAELRRALLEGGVPDDVAQVADGEAATAAALLDGGPDAVSFTGSTAVGRAIASRVGGRMLPLQLEMGGKNVVYVDRSADPETAASTVASGLLGYAGQKCTATSVALVHRGLSESFEQALKSALAAVPPTPPSEEGAVLGPLINAAARDRVGAATSAAAARGLSVASFGAAPSGGAFLPSALVSGGEAEDPIYTEELFGPVLGLREVDSLDAALDQIRALPYGLVSGIVSGDRGATRRFAREVGTGLVRINAPTTGVEPHVPFGGSKESGFGPREQGLSALDFYSETRTVYDG